MRSTFSALILLLIANLSLAPNTPAPKAADSATSASANSLPVAELLGREARTIAGYWSAHHL